MDWHFAVQSFVEMFTTMDFRNGPIVYVIGMAAGLYCCLEGYKIYKMVLGACGFILGFRIGALVFPKTGMTGEVLLMGETFLGLILMVLAYRIFLAGVFIAAFQFASSNLPVYVEAFLKGKSGNSALITGAVVTVVSAVLAFVIAKFSVKMTRPVLVCLTAVVGGFAAVNCLVQLIPVFPYEVELPEASSVIWLFAKMFLSAAGVGVQGIKDPPGAL